MDKLLEHLTQPYPEALARGGVTPTGILWPNAPDLAKRFEVLLGGVDWSAYTVDSRLRVLDLGCGPGFLLDFLAANNLLERVDYTGVDISPVMLAHAQRRWPNQNLILRNVLETPFPEGSFEYAIMCGVFTARFANSYADMEAFTKCVLGAVWPMVTIGLGFNVMSKHVDWERDDLFHWPLDDAMAFCNASMSRHVSLRLDYGPWETSVLVRRNPVPSQVVVPESWKPEAR